MRTNKKKQRVFCTQPQTNVKRFWGIWENEGIDELLRNFDITINDLKDCKILIAGYSDVCYNGEAFVLLSKGSKLLEVNGNHCSCYGLEEQWKPEVTSYKVLLHRINKGTFLSRDYCDGFREAVLEILNGLASN